MIKCSGCDYTANIELARSVLSPPLTDLDSLRVDFYQVLPVQKTLLAVILPHKHSINLVKLNKVYPGAVEMKMEGPNALAELEDRFEKMDVLVDESCMGFEVEDLYRKIEDRFLQLSHPSTSPENSSSPFESGPLSIWSRLPTYSVQDIRQVFPTPQATSTEDNLIERCIKCHASLRSSKAIEVAHTFYLGTKYSEPLSATFSISDPETGTQTNKPFEMGCYGIGISRLLGAIAEYGHKENSLRWPLNVAPFRVCIIISSSVDPQLKSVAVSVAQCIESVVGFEGDVLIDDRNQRVGWKLMDADLIGYPIVVVIGNRWLKDRVIEIRDVVNGKMAVLEDVDVGRLVQDGLLKGAIESIVQTSVLVS